MDISKFKDKHKNKTVLLVGNGGNLSLTPPDKFSHPTIGMNTAHLYEGWSPDYFVTVDRRVFREFGEAINEKFESIPKFLPAPRLNRWKGENIYRFKHLQGLLWPKNGRNLWQDKESLDTAPVIYGNVMHVAIKLAYYMGAKKILIVGMEHEPGKSSRKFWGTDEGMSEDTPTLSWQEGYKVLADGLKKNGVNLLNISPETFVPDNIIKRDSFKKYLPKSKKKVLEES